MGRVHHDVATGAEVALEAARDDVGHPIPGVAVVDALLLLVHPDEGGVVEERRPVALHHRIEGADQVGELLRVPGVDLGRDLAPVLARVPVRRLAARLVGDAVVSRTVAEPAHAHAGLSGRPLERRDPREVALERLDEHVHLQAPEHLILAAVPSLRGLARGPGEVVELALELLDGREVRVEATAVVGAELRAQSPEVVAHRAEHQLAATLARGGHFRAAGQGCEDAIEGVTGVVHRDDRLAGRPIGDAARERLADPLGPDPELEAAVGRVAVEVVGDDLIDRRTARGAVPEVAELTEAHRPRHRGPRGHAVHGALVVAVAPEVVLARGGHGDAVGDEDLAPMGLEGSHRFVEDEAGLPAAGRPPGARRRATGREEEDHAPRHGLGDRTPAAQHGLEEGQRDGDAAGAEEHGASGELLLHGEVSVTGATVS